MKQNETAASECRPIWDFCTPCSILVPCSDEPSKLSALVRVSLSLDEPHNKLLCLSLQILQGGLLKCPFRRQLQLILIYLFPSFRHRQW